LLTADELVHLFTSLALTQEAFTFAKELDAAEERLGLGAGS